MATAKFREASPYTRMNPTPPTEDYMYNKYIESVMLKKDARQPQLRVAIFGIGRAGTIHLNSIMSNPRMKLMYIVEDNESKWSKLRDYWHLDDVTFLNSKQANKVYQDPNVDAVIVASPTFTHETIAKRSLESKKAVFCEKPVAENRANMLKCYELTNKVGKPLFAAFNRRFDPSFAAAHERVKNGEVGHVHVMKVVSRDSPLPPIEYLKNSGGIFQDCMVHDFDMTIWMLGELPIKVTAQGHAHVPEIAALGDYDTVTVMLYFPSGTQAMIDVSRLCNVGYDQRLEVYGPKGLITVDNQRPTPGLTVQRGVQGTMQAPMYYSFPSRYMEAYQREMDHFVDVALGMTDMSVTSKQTLAVSKIASACEESAKTGKPVEIKWSSDEMPEF
ncbi:inositol 2-dehydrogenase [Lasioglossum baleicum]|uniref:inositol 2-dehydrogenase n=1 Tax=Lasioglossum baleicum TaxID=434251 RepID=UPI003FCECC76